MLWCSFSCFNGNHRNGVCHKIGSEGLRSLSWNVTALVLGLVISTVEWWKRPCCFHWVEVLEMNSSKILNNHITYACNCTSAYKPMRPYYPGNHSSPAAVHASSFAQKWKKTTNKMNPQKKSGACQQISSELVFVWPYHRDCWMSKWRTLKRRASLHTNAQK